MNIFRDIRIRLEEINAPEMSDKPKGQLSKDAASSWLSGRSIIVRTYRDTGSYDRYTADLLDSSTGESLTKYLLDNGFAVKYHYPY